MTTSNPSVLIYAPNWLGDLVMSTVLLERCAQAGIQPLVLVRSQWRPLLEHDPRVGGLIDYQRHGRHQGLAGMVRLATDLRSQTHADVVFVLPPSLRSAVVARCAGISKRIGYKGEGRAVLLSRSLPRQPRGQRHFCDEIDDLWTVYSSLEAGPVPLPALPGCQTEHISSDNSRKTWALAVGATYGSAKIWPADIAAQFAQRCLEADIRLLLLGDVGAQEHVQAIKKTCPGIWAEPVGDEAGAVDLTGATDLMGVVEILRTVSVFIGNDSGLMHLSAALGTPTLGLFGPTNPAWTSPRGRCTSVLKVDGFQCSPCYRRTCHEPRFCMETLAAEMVFLAALDLEGC